MHEPAPIICNICRSPVEQFGGGAMCLTLSFHGPCGSESEWLFAEQHPSNGSVHLCMRCIVGLADCEALKKSAENIKNLWAVQKAVHETT